MEYIIAFYFAGVFIAMFKIWAPSYQIIREVDPHNPMSKRPILSTLVVLVLFTLFLPFMVLVLLFDDKAVKFIEHFIKGAIGDEKK